METFGKILEFSKKVLFSDFSFYLLYPIWLLLFLNYMTGRFLGTEKTRTVTLEKIDSESKSFGLDSERRYREVYFRDKKNRLMKYKVDENDLDYISEYEGKKIKVEMFNEMRKGDGRDRFCDTSEIFTNTGCQIRFWDREFVGANA